MNRRALLTAIGASTVGFAGCLEHSLTGDEYSDETVGKTPEGVSAVYTYFKDVDTRLVPDVDDPIVLTERTEVEEELDHDGLIGFAESVDFNDSYLVVSSNETHVGSATDVTVDALKETPEGLQFDVHIEKNYDYSSFSELYDRITDVVGIEVTTEGHPPGSVTVEWFKPHQCQSSYAPYRNLPDPVKREVDGALDDGEYKVVGPLLYPKAVTEEAVLWKDDDYYQSQISEKDGANVLQFEPTTASHGDTTIIAFYNFGGGEDGDHDEELEVSVAITDVDGNVLVDEELSLQPIELASQPIERARSEWISSVEEGKYSELDPSYVKFEDKYGKYTLSIEINGETSVTESISVNPMHRHRLVEVTPDGEIRTYSDYDATHEGFSKPPRFCSTAGGWWGYEGEGGTGTNPGRGPWE